MPGATVPDHTLSDPWPLPTGGAWPPNHPQRPTAAPVLEPRVVLLCPEPEPSAQEKLAAFGAWCAREFRDSLSDVDGGSAQDAMERIGVIVKSTVTEPCGEGCVCVEYGEFPHECFRFPPDVVAILKHVEGA